MRNIISIDLTKNQIFSVRKNAFLEDMSKLLQLYIGGVGQNDYSITWGGGGYAQMITILHGGGGPLGTPKSDYVICARPPIIN